MCSVTAVIKDILLSVSAAKCIKQIVAYICVLTVSSLASVLGVFTILISDKILTALIQRVPHHRLMTFWGLGV